MPRNLDFFKRQVFAGNESLPLTLYSEIFEVADVVEITAQLVVYGANPANATVAAAILHTADPTFSPGSWIVLVQGSLLGVGAISLAGSNPLRWVRASLTIPQASTATAELAGIGRESAA